MVRGHVQLGDLERVIQPARGRCRAVGSGQRAGHCVVPPLAGRAVEAVPEPGRRTGFVLGGQQPAESPASSMPGPVNVTVTTPAGYRRRLPYSSTARNTARVASEPSATMVASSTARARVSPAGFDDMRSSVTCWLPT